MKITINFKRMQRHVSVCFCFKKYTKFKKKSKMEMSNIKTLFVMINGNNTFIIWTTTTHVRGYGIKSQHKAKEIRLPFKECGE
jgi:hypothetical protein